MSINLLKKMLEEIESARIDCDSVGGVIDCVITGVPVGAGEYMFDSVEGVISSLAFAVPAVKGIEFGSGFAFSSMRGSEANDGFYYEDGQVKTFTNNNGGINGGISNGFLITMSVILMNFLLSLLKFAKMKVLSERRLTISQA